MEKHILNTLWIPHDDIYPYRLDWIEQICLLSMLKTGHRVRLFSFGTLEGVPSGIELHDGGDVLSYSSTVGLAPLPDISPDWVHLTGNKAFFSDRFRIKLQEMEAGVWIDTDVYMLRPLLHEGKDIYCSADLYGKITLNGAVLYIRSPSAILQDMADLAFDDYLIPPYSGPTYTYHRHGLVTWERWRQFLMERRDLGIPIPTRSQPWGVIGPHLLTWAVLKHGLESDISPPHIYEPLPPDYSTHACDKDYDFHQYLRPETKAIHLRASGLRSSSITHAPRDSLIGHLAAGVDFGCGG